MTIVTVLLGVTIGVIVIIVVTAVCSIAVIMVVTIIMVNVTAGCDYYHSCCYCVCSIVNDY